MGARTHRITGAAILLAATTAAALAAPSAGLRKSEVTFLDDHSDDASAEVQVTSSSKDRLGGDECHCACSDARTLCIVERTAAANGGKGEKGDMGEPGPPGPTGPQGPTGRAHGKSERPRVRSHRRASQQVAFSVARSNKLGPVRKSTPVTFDRTFTNGGSRFEGSTSEFVAQLNGTYMFFAHVMATADANADAWIMHNDKHQLPLFGDMRAGYATGSNTIILELTAGDRVWVQLSSGSAALNDYTSFSGFLLYEH